VDRGAVAEIDLGAVADNLGLIRKITQRPVIAVVKADAYGHGAVEVSKRLVAEGVSCLAVAFSEEGVRLRNAGIDAPILVFFDKSTSDFFDSHLIPVIHDVPSAVRFSEEAKKRGSRLAVHIEIDTGMGRLGLHSERLMDDIAAIAGLDGLIVEGLMSHFSDADMAERSYAEEQLRKFAEVREKALPILGRDVPCHIANSAAVLSFSEAYLDAVRPGLALYGYSPFSDSREPSTAGKGGSPALDLRPAMTVRTRILSVRRLRKGTPVSYGRTFVTERESLVAVLPVGYADGYGRILSNNAEVLIGGMRAPVIGRVCMDLMMVDVTGVEGVAEGDEVILIGKQGGEEITVHEIAGRAGTISYEVLTTLGNRSKRVYK
jgi:alanine racemase